jgi:hypothetical protein
MQVVVEKNVVMNYAGQIPRVVAVFRGSVTKTVLSLRDIRLNVEYVSKISGKLQNLEKPEWQYRCKCFNIINHK